MFYIQEITLNRISHVGSLLLCIMIFISIFTLHHFQTTNYVGTKYKSKINNRKQKLTKKDKELLK